MTDEEMLMCEQAAANAQAEAAYAELLARGEDTDEAVIDLMEAFTLPTRAEGFVIDGDGQANWALKIIARAEANKRRRSATIQRESMRWEEWQQKGNAADDATIERMTGLLRPYWDQLRAEGAIPKGRKSYQLPNGRLATRTREVKYLRNEAAVIVWAEPLGLIEIEKRLKWAELKRRLQPERNETGAGVIDITTGEYVAGLMVDQPSAEVFEAKADLA